MSRLVSALAALADTALAVALSILVPLGIAAAGWLVSGGFGSTPWEVPLAAATTLWALGSLGAADVTVDPAAFPGLHLAEPFTFTLSLAPLGITAFLAWFAWRTGRRIRGGDPYGWLAVIVSAAAFPLCSLAVAALTVNPIVHVSSVLFGGSIVWTVGLLCGFAVWRTLPWQRILGRHLDPTMSIAAAAVRLALGMVVGMIGLGAVAVLAGLVAGLGRIVGLTQLLQLDGWGVASVGLVELLYLPTLVVWAAAWLLGAGVQLGAGSLATPGATDAGPLPILPLLGAVPEPNGPWLWVVVAAPVLLAAVLMLWLRAGSGQPRGVWWQLGIVAVVGALAGAAVLAGLAAAARGGVGPARLAEFGPQPGPVFVWAACLLLVGAVAGAVAPVSARVGAGTRAAQDARARPAWWRREPDEAAPSRRDEQDGPPGRARAVRAAGAGPRAGAERAVGAGVERGGLPGPSGDRSGSTDRPDWAPEWGVGADDELVAADHGGDVAPQPMSQAARTPEAPADTEVHAARRGASGDAPEGVVQGDAQAARPGPEHPAPHSGARKPAVDLADAVRRPGEPDIYAGIDDE